MSELIKEELILEEEESYVDSVDNYIYEDVVQFS